jgi:hypothetical protein
MGMRKSNIVLLAAVLFCCSSVIVKSQDLMHLADSLANINATPPPLGTTWKDTKIINAQTTKTVPQGTMVFRIQHRFGNAGEESGGGIHTLYGFDEVTDIYMSFEFGILKNLQVGVGRSKARELLDAQLKYRPLTQKSVGMPISLALYGDAALTPESDATFYNGYDPNNPNDFGGTRDRMMYDGEIIVDRKFGNVASLEVFAGLNHRNWVLGLTNTNNNTKDTTNIPYVGGGGKICLSKHAALVFDYYYIMSPYRTNNPVTAYYNAFSIGYEIETGGHVFEINFSNASFIDVNNFIPITTDSWTKGGFKLGFSISRAFNI